MFPKIPHREEVYNEIKNKTNGEIISIVDFSRNVDGDKPILERVPVTAVSELYTDYLFWLSGDKSYEIHENLFRRMINTSLHNVPTELFKLPFNALVLMFPKKIITFHFPEEKFVSHAIVAYGVDGQLRILVRSDDEILQDTDMSFFNIKLTEPEVHQCVAKSVDAMMNQEIEENGITHTKKIDDFSRNEMKEFFEVIMKCILYIVGSDADVVWRGDYAKEKIREKLTRIKSKTKKAYLMDLLKNQHGVYKVGYKIVLSREEQYHYDGVAKGLWKLSHRFMVQGHFRNQPFGEGNKQRRLIFIAPFWKGPDWATLINNPHLVK